MDDPTPETTHPKKMASDNHVFSLKHFFIETDWTLARALATVLQACLFLGIITLAMFSLAAEFYGIIEYQEGLADISTIEAVFIVLTIVLLKRYLTYSKKTSMRWWSKLTTPFIWYGRFMLVIWFAVSVVAFSDLYQETDYLQWAILRSENYSQLLAFTFVLISLYISVPSKKLRLEPNNQNDDCDAINQSENVNSSLQQTTSDI